MNSVEMCAPTRPTVAITARYHLKISPRRTIRRRNATTPLVAIPIANEIITTYEIVGNERPEVRTYTSGARNPMTANKLQAIARRRCRSINLITALAELTLYRSDEEISMIAKTVVFTP